MNLPDFHIAMQKTQVNSTNGLDTVGSKNRSTKKNILSFHTRVQKNVRRKWEKNVTQ